MQRLLVSFLFLCSIVIAGCDSGPETRVVSGSVTLDGEPLDDAYVEFDSRDGTAPTSIDISEGKFSGNVLLGDKTLRFFAIRPAKRDPRLGPTDGHSPFQNVLSDNYGYKSTIKLSIGAEDITDLNYELESK